MKLTQSHRAWFVQQLAAHPPPIYSSYDIRYAGFKGAAVDANIFPAGFNNLDPLDQNRARETMAQYLKLHHGGARRIALLTEEHTNNQYYWRNIAALKKILEGAGCEVWVTMPRLTVRQPMKTGLGDSVEVWPLLCDAGVFKVNSQVPDLVISNNDFADAYSEWGATIPAPMIPAHAMGWHRRKKTMYFNHYNAVASEFAREFKLDPWYFTLDSQSFGPFDVEDEGSLNALSRDVRAMLSRIQAEYDAREIKEKPTVFLKNNSGTYGLGILSCQSADEIASFSYRDRKKMKAAKGGREVVELIVQEGIPAVTSHQNAVAEPVYYFIGAEIAGRFLRAHPERSVNESLNSPGASYVPTPVNSPVGSLEAGVFEVFAFLAATALGREARELAYPAQRALNLARSLVG